MKKYFIFTIIMLVLLFSVITDITAQNLNSLSYYTEEYPPFNFQGEKQLEGITIDLLELIFKEDGLQLNRNDIQLLPWVRGYKYLQTNKKTVLFATTRTEERENQFKWVGPIIPVRIAIISKKGSNISIDKADDLKNYKTAVVRNDVGHQMLLTNGISEKSMIIVSGSSQAAKLIESGRADFFAYDANVAKWVMKSNGINPNNYEEIFLLKDSYLYYAISKDTDDSLVNEFQNALDNVSKADRDKLEAKYLQ